MRGLLAALVFLGSLLPGAAVSGHSDAGDLAIRYLAPTAVMTVAALWEDSGSGLAPVRIGRVRKAASVMGRADGARVPARWRRPLPRSASDGDSAH